MSLKDVLAAAKAAEDARKSSSSSKPASSSSVSYIYDDSQPVDIDKFLEDDSTFNLRLNSVLKKEFTFLCRRQHLSTASALKRYMTECVRIGAVK